MNENKIIVTECVLGNTGVPSSDAAYQYALRTGLHVVISHSEEEARIVQLFVDLDKRCLEGGR